MKQLKDAFERRQVILDLDAPDIASAIRKAVRQMVVGGVLPQHAEQSVVAALLERESTAPTVIGNATAVPHAYLDELERQMVVFVRLAHPIDCGAPDGIPTQFLFFLMGSTGCAAQHLGTLAYVARLMSDDAFRYEAGAARSGDDLLTALDHCEQRTSLDPDLSAERSDGLIYTGRLCGGIQQDVACRWPHYINDFLDGLNVKCVGSTLFLFFACLAPAVTFGGVMAVLTDGQIGAVETITASAICGVMFALFSGQPLIILGGTGPLLVFTAILYRLCSDVSVPFLPTYGWVGLWSAGFLLILAATDASCWMRYFTRFTDEIFAALISLIFIYEAIQSLVRIFEDLDVKKHHDTALLSLLLALGTFYIAISLSRFRRSSYLRPKIREFLSDFGPAIASAATTVVAVWLHEVSLDALPAPDVFGTTNGRPWTVDLLAAPLWVRFAAAGPALLVTVLVFLDQNITARIVNSPDHRLCKGQAYHLDLGVVPMSGNQFFERLSLWLKDPAPYPVTHYIRRVPRWTIHAFTLLQLACLGVLWYVKSSSVGILFPVFIALLVPVRLLAARFFSAEDLAVLDAEEEPDEEQTHWAV
jgi:mannitol/fructose-specific phosphotransferase system IIA component (Ntr-type)